MCHLQCLPSLLPSSHLVMNEIPGDSGHQRYSFAATSLFPAHQKLTCPSPKQHVQMRLCFKRPPLLAQRLAAVGPVVGGMVPPPQNGLSTWHRWLCPYLGKGPLQM